MSLFTLPWVGIASAAVVDHGFVAVARSGRADLLAAACRAAYRRRRCSPVLFAERRPPADRSRFEEHGSPGSRPMRNRQDALLGDRARTMLVTRATGSSPKPCSSTRRNSRWRFRILTSADGLDHQGQEALPSLPGLGDVGARLLASPRAPDLNHRAPLLLVVEDARLAPCHRPADRDPRRTSSDRAAGLSASELSTRVGSPRCSGGRGKGDRPASEPTTGTACWPSWPEAPLSRGAAWLWATAASAALVERLGVADSAQLAAGRSARGRCPRVRGRRGSVHAATSRLAELRQAPAVRAAAITPSSWPEALAAIGDRRDGGRGGRAAIQSSCTRRGSHLHDPLPSPSRTRRPLLSGGSYIASP